MRLLSTRKGEETGHANLGIEIHKDSFASFFFGGGVMNERGTVVHDIVSKRQDTS